ncbi:hypothetical protein HN974_05100 [bacterium]|nr:hypothetical protein [bacterium]
MKKIKNYWKKNWHFYLLIGFMLIALGIRSWNIEETVYFRMDQARDAKLIQTAFNGGVEELPLLGPRAAGSFLRLGPIFYYFQFASAKFFGSMEPYVLAFPDLLFSVLTIPLFYYFLRSFFSKKVSIIVIGVFSSSFILTQYARFAWNPNSIPFWALLTLLGAFKCVVQKDAKKAGKWLLLAAFGYAIASQLHFTAFLALPVVVALFWIFNWPRKIKLKFWFLALGILAFFYIPVAISEVFTGFDNTHQFLYALSTKGSDDVAIAVQLDQSLRLHAKYYSMILTSYGNLSSKELIWFLAFMIIFSFWRFRRVWKTEKWHTKKAFISLVASWFLVFVVLYSKLAMDISKPRFWLLIAFLPFVFLALLFQWFEGFKYKKISKVLVAGIASFLIIVNSYAVGYWYYSLDKQKEGEGSYIRDLELKQGDLIGVKQLRIAAQEMLEVSKKQNKKLCFRSEQTYLSPYGYIFGLYYPESEVKRISFSTDTNQSCAFASVRHGNTENASYISKKHKDEFEIVSEKVIGNMKIWELSQKEDIAKQKSKEKEEAKALKREEKLKKESIETQSEDSLIEEDGLIEAETEQTEQKQKEEQERKKKLPRKERVFWKHVLGKEEYKG